MLNDFTSDSPSPAMVDSNLWYSRIGADSAKFVWRGTLYTGYAAYRSAAGNDANSPPFFDPQFARLGKPPDLDIENSSPAIDAAAVLAPGVVGTRDVAGRNRTKAGTIDIGAYEK
ncbi:MAG: choice-of-anchor Q domain-containing protein [Rhizomicrobium sp.]|jgi:hypothetical protein